MADEFFDWLAILLCIAGYVVAVAGVWLKFGPEVGMILGGFLAAYGGGRWLAS